jgi:hypothetical protein
MFEFRARGEGGSTDLRQQYQRAAKLGEIWNREVSVQPSPFTWAPSHSKQTNYHIYVHSPTRGENLCCTDSLIMVVTCQTQLPGAMRVGEATSSGRKSWLNLSNNTIRILCTSLPFNQQNGTTFDTCIFFIDTLTAHELLDVLRTTVCQKKGSLYGKFFH